MEMTEESVCELEDGAIDNIPSENRERSQSWLSSHMVRVFPGDYVSGSMIPTPHLPPFQGFIPCVCSLPFSAFNVALAGVTLWSLGFPG